MTTVPAKYQPKERKYEQKDWLYQRYWGEMQPIAEIADECDISTREVRRLMDEHGIPSRTADWNTKNTVSPFRGFYNDEIAQATEQSNDVFKPDNSVDHDGDFAFDHWVGVGD